MKELKEKRNYVGSIGDYDYYIINFSRDYDQYDNRATGDIKKSTRKW